MSSPKYVEKADAPRKNMMSTELVPIFVRQVGTGSRFVLKLFLASHCARMSPRLFRDVSQDRWHALRSPRITAAPRIGCLIVWRRSASVCAGHAGLAYMHAIAMEKARTIAT